MIDLVIIGAGIAGLAAAARAREAGLSTLVLEAGPRVGGRAWTTQLAGRPFDQGATWLHHAATNPLAALAAREGDRLVDYGARRGERLFIQGRPATDAEMADEATAETRITGFLSRRAATGPDVSLAEAAAPLVNEPWLATTLMWEASIIAAADPDVLSLHDWHTNLLEGANMMVEGGLGNFIARRLVPPAGEIRLDTSALAVRRGTPCVVETARGDLRARAVIVTVSTGVLAAGALRFAPDLPPATQAAIDGLPMGLLSKVALPATGPDRLDLPESCSVWSRQEGAGEAALVLNAWPLGHGYALGHFGGRTAWTHTDPAEAEALVRAEWRRLFGARAERSLGGPAVVTDWGTNKLFRGAYAYARPGQAGARQALAAPIDGGRLVFAGEACHPTLAGTVGGAWLDGRRAAEVVMQLVGVA